MPPVSHQDPRPIEGHLRPISGGQQDKQGTDEALAAVLGGIAYALLRVFRLSAEATGFAPSLALAERQAAFAVEEHERFRAVRKRLGAITDDVDAAVARFRPALDAFYEATPINGWLEAQVFHFVGDTITADFAELFAGVVDDKTATAVREALTGRGAHDGFALEQIDRARATQADAEDRIVAVASKIVGEAINRVRDAMFASDSLEVVFGGPDAVKDAVLEILGRHRERLERLGLDRLD